jgi:hypothetical protein
MPRSEGRLANASMLFKLFPTWEMFKMCIVSNLMIRHVDTQGIALASMAERRIAKPTRLLVPAVAAHLTIHPQRC